ncbi:hypothetical protein NA57DRAFT_66460 [Rhizodiscina lignyota]|uniref:Integral membrane protein n=1 Tax=Rhizodiscina lignyota TaxID=1504668 RepID=A0A9P4IEP5_9PEZI|nr:hypothetical protein NA57DRAFT_66460 [Rhizodiscina lignyota]
MSQRLQMETRQDPWQTELALLWRSRDNRKGRNSIVIPTTGTTRSPFTYRPPLISSLRDIGRNVWRMLTVWSYWDMSWWTAMGYTVGSVLWVINGCFAWIPIAFPNTEFPNEVEYGVGITSFLGVICFQVGATMALLEAVNDGSFHGSAMRRLLEGREEDQKKMVDEKIHSFLQHTVPHRRNRDEEEAEKRADRVDPEAGWRTKERRERPGSVYPPTKAPAPRRRGALDLGAKEGESSEYLTFRWWPTWRSLRSHHIYEIGFLACFVQFVGATAFIVTGVVALPGILDTLEQWQLNAAYWIPQMVASSMFITASALFTLETQEKWFKPNPMVLGWWIGFWALIGSIGFELCGSLGPASGNSGAVYQSSLSSLWGSCAFLISSVLQWYEAMNKNPVDELFNEPGEMKSSEVHPI